MKKIVSLMLLLFLVFCFNGLHVSPVKAEPTVDLTQEEIQFLEDNPSILMGVDNGFIPYEFIDIDGEYKGICAEYIAIIEERTGLSFEIPFPDLPWADTYDLALNGELDVLPCIGITEEREEFFEYSDSYVDFERVIFSRNNNDQYVLGDLPDLKVGAQRNSSHHSFLLSEDDVEVLTFNTVHDGVLALSKGEIDVFVGNKATTSYIIKSLGVTNLEVNETLVNNKLAFGVVKDNPILTSIINKGLASVTEEEKIEIVNKWIAVSEVNVMSEVARIALIVLGILAVVVVINLIWIVRLGRENKRREEEIQYRIKLQEELSIAKKIAEDAREAESQFLANMSHEIRTPLNAITGILGLLVDMELTNKQRDYLSKMNKASDNLLLIVNDILDFSRIEAGELKLEEIEFDLYDVIEGAIISTGTLAYDKDLELINLNFADQKCKLVGDPLRLGQVLLNLLANGIKFTLEGFVQLEVRIVDEDDKNISIQFSVKDSGIGISEEKQQLLFTAFKQVDSSTSRLHGGTGLGLAISQRLVNGMGSEIVLESFVGKGSTFSFTIQFKKGKSEIKSRYDQSVDFSDIKAMIVDDNHSVLEGMKHHFEKFNVDTLCVSNSEIAVEQIDESYNLIVIDHYMPKINGIETFEKINQKLGDHKIKSVLLTKSNNEDIQQAGIDANFDAVYIKPLNGSMIFNLLSELTGKELTTGSYSQTSTLDTINLMKEASVLVVDDNDVNRLVISEILTTNGIKVTMAEDGKEAVEIFEGNPTFDLILMDIQMPVMNGFEATKAIRDQGYTVPIIALTADVLSGFQNRLDEYGLSGYVSKPINVALLFDEMSRVTNMKRKRVVVSKGNTDEFKKIMTRFDFEAVLERIGYKVDIVKKLYRFYLEESTKLLIDIDEYSKLNNLGLLRSTFHNLKGVSGSVGASHTHELAKKAESSLKSKDINKVMELYSELMQSVEKDNLEIRHMSDAITEE